MLADRLSRTMLPQGTQALRAVAPWNWESVAGQYATLLTNGTIRALAKDPFEALKAIELPARWCNQRIELLSGHSWDFKRADQPKYFYSGVFAIWVDGDIQASSCQLQAH